MNSVDLSFATHRFIDCFGTIRPGQTDFGESTLVNASLYKASFSFTGFAKTNFTLPTSGSRSFTQRIFDR
jgi:hypothetical protein